MNENVKSFSATSSSTVDPLTLNQYENDHRPILHNIVEYTESAEIIRPPDNL